MDRYCTHCRSGEHWTSNCPHLTSFPREPPRQTHGFSGSAVERAKEAASKRDLSWAPRDLPLLPDHRRRLSIIKLTDTVRSKSQDPDVIQLCDETLKLIQAIVLEAKKMIPSYDSVPVEEPAVSHETKRVAAPKADNASKPDKASKLGAKERMRKYRERQRAVKQRAEKQQASGGASTNSDN